MNGMSRRERGELQRARFRDLVTSAEPGSTRGLDGLDDLARLEGPAAWWARQHQWGRQITGPAQQLAASIQSLRSSRNQDALVYELGRLALGFSTSALPHIGRFQEHAAEPTTLPCLFCGATAPARTWREPELEFLRICCPDCHIETATSRIPTSQERSWTATERSGRSLDLHDVKVAAASIDGAVVNPAPGVPISIAPRTARTLMILDLAPTEIVWSRP
jgi:hypothetical protein